MNTGQGLQTQELRSLPLWLLALFMLLVVGTWSASIAYKDYESVIEQQYRLLEIRARQRGASISGSLRSVELMLRGLDEDLRDSPNMSVADQNKLAREYLRRLPELRNLVVEDATGRIQAEANETSIGMDASGRDYFKAHRSTPLDDKLFLSRPFKAFSGVTGTTLSRVRRDKQDRFAGVLVASLDVKFFADALKLVVYESGIESSLINLQGDILSTVPPSEHVGKNLQGNIAFTEHINSGQSTTRHLNQVGLDPVVEMAVFHNLPNAPLAVVVSRDYSRVMDEWRQSLYSHVAGFLLLAAMTIFFAWSASRRQYLLSIAHQQAVERELELRTIIETEPECVKQLAADGTLLAMNPAGLDMIEADSLDQVIGRNLRELVAAEYQKAFLALNRKVFSGESGRLEFEIQGLKGGRRWMETHAVPLRDARGQVKALLGLSRDITERKRIEEELIRHRDHLEELVAARTSELEKSRDAAEAGNRAKTIFLANMSHELRTPMNGVTGMIDLVLRRATDPKQIDWLNKSKSSAQRMLNVVNDILDFSKIEAERLPLEEKNFSLTQMIDEAIAMQVPTAQAKGLILIREIPATFPDQLSGDAFRLRQILLNFLGNACKFSDQGTITVRVSAVEQAGDSVLARIEVEDQGIGISPEQQAVLFQAFTQADGSMTRKYGGSGLGLIISKRLANLMGGDVGLVSQEGRGSTFWATVRLKLAKASEVAN